MSTYPTNVPQALSPFPPNLVYGGTADVEGEKNLQMTVVRFGEGHPAFQPSIIVGSPGQRLTISIDNQTPVRHNFSTLNQRIDRDIGVGKSISVTVTFPTKGSLIFYCKYHVIPDFQIGELQAQVG